MTDGDTWYTTSVVLAVVDSSPTNLVASSAVSASFDYTISFANAVATPEAEIRLTTSSCLIPAGAYSYRCEACFLICVCVRACACVCVCARALLQTIPTNQDTVHGHYAHDNRTSTKRTYSGRPR